jgi:hypothetical protein
LKLEQPAGYNYNLMGCVIVARPPVTAFWIWAESSAPHREGKTSEAITLSTTLPRLFTKKKTRYE